jgi:hypothetical protein
MADDHDSLMREVQEELRRERLQKIWEQYQALIIAIVVLIPVSVFGYQAWRESGRAASEASGANFEAALRLSDDKKSDEALKAFETIAAGSPGGYGSLAKLYIAGAQAKAGKTSEALATYEALSKDGSADRILRDFAALQAASLRAGDADFTEMQNRLTSLTADGQPFRTSASEILGVAAFKAGKTEEARNLLEPLLIDPAASRAIQERIKIVLAEIASADVAKAQSPAEAKPADAEPEKK